MTPTPFSAPTHAGAWLYYETEKSPHRTVTVTESPTSGRRCDELRMGGSHECGYAAWSGIWLPCTVSPGPFYFDGVWG